MLFCGYCGSQMPDDMRFCTKCGKPLDVTGEQPNLDTNGNSDFAGGMNVSDSNSSVLYQQMKYNAVKEAESKKKKNTLPGTLTLIFVLIALLMIVGNYSRRTTDVGSNDASISSVAESPAPVQPVQTVQTPAVSASPSPSPEPSANEYVYRIERDGSMVIKRDAEIRYCRVSVPYYWGEEESTSKSVRLVAESENCIAAIQMEVTMDSDDYSWFKDRDKIEKIIRERILNNPMGQLSVNSATYYEAESGVGILCELSAYTDGHEFTGKAFLTPSKDYKHLIYIILIQSDNTKFLYNDDFMMIIDTIERTE